MKLKKLSALLLALCMVFALAACNNNEEVTPSPSPVTSDEPSPSPTTNQVMSPRRDGPPGRAVRSHGHRRGQAYERQRRGYHRQPL